MYKVIQVCFFERACPFESPSLPISLLPDGGDFSFTIIPEAHLTRVPSAPADSPATEFAPKPCLPPPCA
ncbi:hypothetical protein B0H17DRAFT_1057601 [Mycena rosella]|uniref:Uncharacterized protein n=1 Tax=Mycena rosella TaxID=1033263 RepID=A0AAD7DM06_MYCRO|nr:hypothetical protein B0H17DRAFT_1057601 [Mycena rosella]